MAAKIHNYKKDQKDYISFIRDTLIEHPEFAGEGTALKELLDKSQVDILSRMVPTNKKIKALQ
jgi:hypothetical protein